MTIAVIKSRIRKINKTVRREYDLHHFPRVVSHTLLPCLFQLVSNLLFHFLRQNATVRDFLVIHQVFVEVSEIQSVELNFLQLINRNPPDSQDFLALPNPIRNCPLRPLLLDYLRQLRIKLAVAALFSAGRRPAPFFEQNSPTLTVSLLSFAFPSAFFFTVALRQPHILTPSHHPYSSY